MPDIRKGRPLPRSLDGSECSAHGDRNMQPPATNCQELTTWKRNTMYVANLDTCAYFIRAGHQPDPHRPVHLRVVTEFK